MLITHILLNNDVFMSDLTSLFGFFIDMSPVGL